MKKISIIGAGAWGTTLSILLAQNGFDVSLWSFEKSVVEEFQKTRENKKYLAGFPLPIQVEITNDLEKCINGSEAVIFVVPTQHLRSIAKESAKYIEKNIRIASAAKGLEISTLKRPSEIISEIIGNHVAVLSGPNIAREIAQGLPAAAVVAIDSEKIKTAEYFQSLFAKCNTFRVYTNQDPIGVEIGAALKNVIAIAAGALDALNLGDNAKAALIIRGIAEISRLAEAMGAKPETLSGLSGLGDLITTCQSKLSRNHQVGERLAKGEKLESIISTMKDVAEGIPTTKAAMQLKDNFGVSMPITEEIYKVLFENKSIGSAIQNLMSRPQKSEN